MARGNTIPKPADQRARRNKDHVQASVLTFVPGVAPDLPPMMDGYDWHPQAKIWWETWKNSQQATLMTDVDWRFMLMTALLVHQFWEKGHWTLAQEIRLREAKFGATPEDRARLRIQFADADERDAARPAGELESAAQSKKYGQLKALPAPPLPSEG